MVEGPPPEAGQVADEPFGDEAPLLVDRVLGLEEAVEEVGVAESVAVNNVAVLEEDEEDAVEDDAAERDEEGEEGLSTVKEESVMDVSASDSIVESTGDPDWRRRSL